MRRQTQLKNLSLTSLSFGDVDQRPVWETEWVCKIVLKGDENYQTGNRKIYTYLFIFGVGQLWYKYQQVDFFWLLLSHSLIFRFSKDLFESFTNPFFSQSLHHTWQIFDESHYQRRWSLLIGKRANFPWRMQHLHYLHNLPYL